MNLIQRLNSALDKGLSPDQIAVAASNPITTGVDYYQVLHGPETQRYFVAWIIDIALINSYSYRDGCYPDKYNDEGYVCYYHTPGGGLVGNILNAHAWTAREITDYSIICNFSSLLFIPTE